MQDAERISPDFSDTPILKLCNFASTLRLVDTGADEWHSLRRLASQTRPLHSSGVRDDNFRRMGEGGGDAEVSLLDHNLDPVPHPLRIYAL